LEDGAERKSGVKTVVKLIASGLYTGYSPIAPGTIGSVLGVLIFLQLQESKAAYILVCLLLTVLGFLVAGPAEKLYNKKDPRVITIDEIAGMCIVYLGMPPKMWVIITGFVFYRIFDIVKPPPARNAESLKGSLGIMLDDIIAAVYANIILQILTRVVLRIGS